MQIITEGPEPYGSHKPAGRVTIVGLNEWSLNRIKCAISGPRYEESLYDDPKDHKTVQEFLLPGGLVLVEMVQVSHKDLRDGIIWIFTALFDRAADGGRGGFVEESKRRISKMQEMILAPSPGTQPVPQA